MQWNQSENWSKVFINLGNIHAVIHVNIHLYFLVQLDHIHLGLHWRNVISAINVASRRYEHGFALKALQSLSDIT